MHCKQSSGVQSVWLAASCVAETWKCDVEELCVLWNAKYFETQTLLNFAWVQSNLPSSDTTVVCLRPEIGQDELCNSDDSQKRKPGFENFEVERESGKNFKHRGFLFRTCWIPSLDAPRSALVFINSVGTGKSDLWIPAKASQGLRSRVQPEAALHDERSAPNFFELQFCGLWYSLSFRGAFILFYFERKGKRREREGEDKKREGEKREKRREKERARDRWIVR